MTGPEHYREAERLLGGAQNVMDVAPIDGLTRTECAELAQAHFLGAIAAAVAINPSKWPGAVNDLAWAKAAGEQGDAANVYRGGE